MPFKAFLKAIIYLTQLITCCVWCFFLGSILGTVMLIIGFFTGLQSGVWDEFYFGVFFVFCHLISLPFSFTYKKIYGSDEWFKSETFFGI